LRAKQRCGWKPHLKSRPLGRCLDRFFFDYEKYEERFGDRHDASTQARATSEP